MSVGMHTGAAPAAEPLPLRFGWKEWTGALGDLGTFVPLFLGLVAFNGLPAARTLLLFGAVYIASAVAFRLPAPVQPLKAVAAIAIAGGMGMAEISAAGISIGVILLLLVLMRRIEWLAGLFDRVIVKGIQFGVGLMLIRAGVGLLAWGGFPDVQVGGVADWGLPAPGAFLAAFPVLVLPQLPLTLGNAVYAVSDVARDYFGRGAGRASPRNLALSLGVANVLIGVAGGLPVCHGSGGLTAHYRFGGRTGGCTIITGAIFIALTAIFLLSGTLLLRQIPPWVLGSMLLYVGASHALLLRGLEERRLVAIAMGAVGLATSNLFYAMLFGLALDGVWRARAVRH